MKTVLALDVSSRACGWAFGWPNDVPASGVVQFGKSGGTEDDAWRNALVWMNEQMGMLNPDIVAIEAAIMSSAPGQGGFTNPQTQGLLWGLQSVMRTVVKARKPGRAVMVNASSARKTFTGRGNYPKGEAKSAVQAECLRRGWLAIETLDPDRADALCVWCHVAALQAPELAFIQPKHPRQKALADVGF